MPPSLPSKRSSLRAGATVLIAPTAFKGTLSPVQAERAIARGWRRARPFDRLVSVPMADGGDGTAEVLHARLGGRWLRRRVHDPLGRTVTARALMLPDGTAVVEMAAASGLWLLSPGELDPLLADTRGTGELVRACLLAGARRVLLGLGGSATTDGGAGCAHALGVRFLDSRGRELDPVPAELMRVRRVDVSRRLEGTRRVEALVDVTNPLLGRRGAAPVYGPQKGASAADVRLLSRSLSRLRDAAGGRAKELAMLPGAGAAGGLGFGVAALLGGRLVPGAGRIADALRLDRELRRAHLVVTGEGRLDQQTLQGKAPFEVARRARLAGVPCVAVTGSSELPPAAARRAGFSRVKTLEGATVEDASWALAASI